MKAFTLFGPPGTGKTTDLLARVVHAKDRGYPVNSIAYLSFTRAAAQEACKRLGIKRSPMVCTIHSLMYRLTGLTSDSVVDARKLQDFGRLAGFEFTGQSTDTAESMGLGDQFAAVLSRARNRLTDPLDEWADSHRPGEMSQFRTFVKAYDEWKESNGFVDYTDMLERYCSAPVPHGARVMFVDEAQDLSNLQWLVIEKMLSFGTIDEVTVAGDDDQAIYEWSGANPHGMRRFEEHHDAERTVLKQSWRVPKAPFSMAAEIIKRVRERVPKVYRPQLKEGVIAHTSWFSHNMVQHGRDTLILCRSFMTKQRVETELAQYRVPYSSDGGRPSLFQNRLAAGIKAFRKLEAGHALSAEELQAITAVADYRTRTSVSAKDLNSLVRRGWRSCLVIPPHLVDFYESANLDVLPTIRVSTIHSSKGREADHVVVHTELTDKTRVDMERNGDAEHRVWYVAVTRTRDRLDIINSEGGYAA